MRQQIPLKKILDESIRHLDFTVFFGNRVPLLVTTQFVDLESLFSLLIERIGQ